MPKSWIKIVRDSSIKTKAQDGYDYFQGYEIRRPEIDVSDLKQEDVEEIFLLQAIYHYIVTQREFLSQDGKTQVLNIGVEDRSTNITTRLGHDMQVSQNAMRIALILSQKQPKVERYRNVLLAQIIGIAHDIGHAPFGHAGESAISDYLSNYGIRFNHSKYGANLIKNMIEDVIYEISDIGEEQTELRDDEARKFLEELVKEVAVGVENHSTYYSSGVENETIPQKATRLADGISYMVSDLSDLLRSDLPVVTREILTNAYNSLGFEIGNTGDLSFEEILDKLEEGGDSLRDLQRLLLSEAFSRNRVFNETVITDDYKMLMDIKSFYPPIMTIETENSYYQRIPNEMASEDRNKAMAIISQYYSYMTAMRNNGKYNEYLYNSDFVKRMDEILEGYRDEVLSGKLDSEVKFKDRVVFDRKIIESLDRKIREIEQIESVTSPTIMALFAIQNKIQYQQILRDGEGKALNNNEEVTRERITMMMDRVAKYAYAASRKPEEYCNEEEMGDISFYNERAIPDITKVRPSDMPEYVEGILAYATFVVQQMQNKDFESPESMQRIIDNVIQELGIREDKVPEIEQMDPKFFVVIQTRQRRTKDHMYIPKDVLELTRKRNVTLEDYTRMSKRTLSKAERFIEDPNSRVIDIEPDKDSQEGESIK